MAAGKFDGDWQITITDGTFHINYGGIVEDQPYAGAPGSITVTKGKPSGNTYGGQTSYSGTVGNGGAGSFTISDKSGPPSGSLALAGTAAPDAQPAKKTYTIHGGSTSITGRVYAWPSKLKIHVKLTGGGEHARVAGAKWLVKLSTPHTGKYTLTTWFTDATGHCV